MTTSLTMDDQIKENYELLLDHLEKDFVRLYNTKFMLNTHKYILPDEFINLFGELLTNIEVNINYIERIFSKKPTRKYVNTIWKAYKDNWDLFISP